MGAAVRELGQVDLSALWGGKGAGMASVEWVDHGTGGEVAYITLPDETVLRLTHRFSDGYYAVFDEDGGFGIPEDSGHEGRSGALQGAAEVCRHKMSDWAALISDLEREAMLPAAPTRP